MYGNVGGCQGVALQLPGFLYVVAMGLCLVARVFISDWCMGMWVVAKELLIFLYVVAMGFWVVARVFVWLLVCCAWFL